MILKTFLREKPPVAWTTLLGLFLAQSGVAVHNEQDLSHLCLVSYRVLHALHVYLFAIATLMF